MSVISSKRPELGPAWKLSLVPVKKKDMEELDHAALDILQEIFIHRPERADGPSIDVKSSMRGMSVAG